MSVSKKTPLTEVKPELGEELLQAPGITEVTPETPPAEERTIEKEVEGMTRRVFNRVVGLLGVGLLVKGIIGGSSEDSAHHSSPEAIPSGKALSEKLENMAQEIAQKVEKEHPELSDREKLVKVVDYLGVALFAWGVKDLMPENIKDIIPKKIKDALPNALIPEPKTRITALHYAVLTALSGLKYGLSDEKGRHHLMDETKSNAKALGIIGGTVALAEGIQLDLEKAYEQMMGAAPSQADKIGAMTLFASCLSPLVTTVGSASIVKNLAQDIAKGDTRMAAVCVNHVSNLSGFLLFGDPPFIAICERMGFLEGVKWQMQHVWPLAIYSLMSATCKLNYLALKDEKLSPSERGVKAAKNAVAGTLGNISFMLPVIGYSLLNVAKYFGFQEKQGINGLQLSIGEVLTKKIENFGKLLGEPAEAIHSEKISAPTAVEQEKVIGSLEKGTTFPLPVPDTQRVFQEQRKAYEQEAEQKKPLTLGVVKMKMIAAAKAAPSAVSQAASNATDTHKLEHAIGGNLKDILNVFPFQAGCVPFLVTGFKDAVSGLEMTGMSESYREIVLFFMIMGFSCVADNYVACKIGLELFPKGKEHYPLIASVQGGALTSIGNMANLAQFSLNEYPLLESLKKMGWHIDTIAASALWTMAIDLLKKLEFLPGVDQEKSRRDLFKAVLGR